jgi:hypothetical protein
MQNHDAHDGGDDSVYRFDVSGDVTRALGQRDGMHGVEDSVGSQGVDLAVCVGRVARSSWSSCLHQRSSLRPGGEHLDDGTAHL